MGTRMALVHVLALTFVLALAGCQQVYGLTPPTLAADAAGDRDFDGVPDDIDNCERFNPDQADADHDRIGDVCEGCVALPLRTGDDDDADGFDDTVDRCIGTPGTTMTDSDLDALWDDCDPRQGTDVRFCVMTLREPTSTEGPWSEVIDTTGWQLANSAATTTETAVASPLMTRAPIDEGPNGIAFEARIGVTGYTAPAHVGLHLESEAGTYDCRIEARASSADLSLYRDGTLLTSSSIAFSMPSLTTAVLRLTFDLEPSGVTTTCEVDPSSLSRVMVSASETTLPPPLRVGVASESMNTAVYDFVIDKLGE